MRYIICVAMCVALQTTAVAQNGNLRFRHLSVQDGLSRSWVKCFLEDRTGLLWIGTADGLNKFDGKKFTIYKYLPELPNSLNHNNINLIFEDSRGELWIGTQAGLNYYQREHDEFIPCSSVNNYITSIYELKPGILLVGAAGGIFLFNTDTRTAVQLYNGFYVEKILKDDHGNIWLATHKGLMLFNAATHAISNISFDSTRGHTLRDGYLKTIFQDSRGGLWVGSIAEGLFYFNYTSGNGYHPKVINFKPDPAEPAHITPGAILAIAEDDDHNIWLGIENGGINLINLEAFNEGDYFFTKVVSNPSDPLSLSNNSIHALYTDKQHTLWAGTYGGGANHYNKLLQRFGHHDAIPGSDKTINNKYVNAVRDETDYLWIGTEEGLNRFTKKTGHWEYFTHNFSNTHTLGSNAVLTITRDREQRLWIGTWNGGLNYFDEVSEKFTRFRHEQGNTASLSGDNICNVIEGDNHHLWIGVVGGGLVDYDTEKNSFTSYRENPDLNAISSNWVIDMIRDHLGNLWISTTEAVDVFNPETKHFTSFTHDAARPESINYNGGTCLFQDSRHTIWIGTSNGLNYFVQQDSSFHQYTVEDGLPNNFIKSITEDREGNIWLSTNNTLTMLRNGTALPEHPEFRSFSVFDGMPSSEFIAGSVFSNSKGELYFGSTNGYFAFDPSNIKSNTAIPKIVFTDLRINNIPVNSSSSESPLQEDISMTRQLKLSPKQNVFTIGFAALNFIEPENNEYAYKLEGFDKQWNMVGHQQNATYTNLDPGTYTFRVKASNNDGYWNEDGIALEIIVLPAWWQTWIAKVIYGMLFILAVFFFRKHTIISVNLKNVLWREHLEKQKSEELAQMKQEFFANISHEIRTPLTLILGPLTKLMKENRKLPQLNLIFRNSLRLKKLIDQFLDFTKMESRMMTIAPSRSEIRELTTCIIADFVDYAGQKNVEMKLETTFTKCVGMIDQDKYEKILANLLSNAVKSITGKGTVTTQLNYNRESSTLVIRIVDTGRGIAPEECQHIFERYYSGPDHLKNINGTGIGLYLTRELIHLQKGSIHVNSIVGEGSAFTLRLPLQVSEFESGDDTIVYTVEESLPVVTKEIPAVSAPMFERTILIIDDNEAMCDYVDTTLNSEFNVIKENNPVKAIHSIMTYMPDLVISDIMMPEMDGLELCRSIKEDVRFSHIPILLLTAKTTRQDHIAGYETGADDYVYKPFDEEILRARVKSLITRTEKLKQHFIGHDGIINPGVPANALDVKFMEDILAEIRQHYADPQFSVNQIIEKIGMSRSLFYKKFKALSGQSINDLIRNFRLKKAAALLANGTLTVSEVAYDCGFTDPAYFSRVFKEYYSVVPKDFAHENTIAQRTVSLDKSGMNS